MMAGSRAVQNFQQPTAKLRTAAPREQPFADLRVPEVLAHDSVEFLETIPKWLGSAEFARGRSEHFAVRVDRQHFLWSAQVRLSTLA
jgi:hypothetical protein